MDKNRSKRAAKPTDQIEGKAQRAGRAGQSGLAFGCVRQGVTERQAPTCQRDVTVIFFAVKAYEFALNQLR